MPRSSTARCGSPGRLTNVSSGRERWSECGAGSTRPATTTTGGSRSAGCSRSGGCGTRRALAALFYASDRLDRAVDRPARRVWERLEELLIEDGAVDEDGLDAET